MNEKVLIADDKLSITEILKMNFELLEYKVTVAHDGEEAILKARAVMPDIILLDIMMPKKNGYQVCRELKSDPKTSRIPIIMVTAKVLKDDIYWGYDCGADAYVCKPFEPLRLEFLVKRLIDESKMGPKPDAWTGLAGMPKIENKLKNLKDSNTPFMAFEASIGEAGTDVFLQKYGEKSMRDIIAQSADYLKLLLENGDGSVFVGQRADDAFIIITTLENAQNLTASIKEKLTGIIQDAYDAIDKARGGILYRDVLTGKDIKSPLMYVEIKRIS